MALVFISCFSIGWNEAVVATMVTFRLKDQRDIGAAAGLSGSIRSLLGSASAAIYSAILRSRLSHTVPAKVPAAVIEAGLPASSVPAFIQALELGTAAALTAVKGVTPQIIAAGTRAYQVANADAYRTVFLATIAFGGLGILLGVFIPNADDHLTGDIAVKLHAAGEKDASNTVGDKPLHLHADVHAEYV